MSKSQKRRGRSLSSKVGKINLEKKIHDVKSLSHQIDRYNNFRLHNYR
jgi:hypothetical protein